MATAKLITFPLHAFPADQVQRQASIDPKKVTSVRETVHGSVIIAYNPKTFFEVAGRHADVVKSINEARA